MATYRYIVYCGNEGPTVSNPFRPIFTEEEILGLLRDFKYQLAHFFNQPEPEIVDVFDDRYDVPSPAVSITIYSAETENVVNQLLRNSINGLDLYAKKI